MNEFAHNTVTYLRDNRDSMATLTIAVLVADVIEKLNDENADAVRACIDELAAITRS